LQASEVSRAVAAALSIASAQGLAARDAVILHNSNKLALRLLPCDAFARVAPAGHEVAAYELDVAQRLAAARSPVAALEPRVEPRPFEHDGFVVTLWTYHPTATPAELAPADFAAALARLHAGMRTIDIAAPHFTDRVAEAQQIVADRSVSPALAEADRTFLADRLVALRQAVTGRGAPEQLLHGEPHPGNVLNTMAGPVFIDLETCCHGPVEFDLAHAPVDVANHYPGADQELPPLIMPEEFLAATRKSQEAMIRAIKTWVETVRTVTPKLPSAHGPLADRLP